MTETSCPYCAPGTCAVPYGTCHCGCGEQTTVITKKNHAPDDRGRLTGRPRKFLKAHNRRKLSVEQYTELLARVDAGELHRTIAADLGISTVSVSKYALDHGRRRQHYAPRWHRQEDIDEILRLYREGHRTEDIAAKFDMVANNVSRIANAHGLRRNKVRSDRKRQV